MVPTYGCKGARRYTYYASRKDLTRAGDPKGTRFRRGEIEDYLAQQLTAFLNDEHALRLLSGFQAGAVLQKISAVAKLQSQALARPFCSTAAFRAIVEAVHVTETEIRIELRPDAIGASAPGTWTHRIPRPPRHPFREAKLRIDAKRDDDIYDNDLFTLLSDAMEVQRLVLQSPELSLSRLGKREGRCRAHLGRLLRLSWLSPRLVEAIATGTQPRSLTCHKLLSVSLPPERHAQERLLGLAA